MGDFIARLQRVRQNGDGFVANCPACGDEKQHLSVSAGSDGRILMKCFKECQADSIVRAMGLGLKDLYPPSEKPAGKWQDATYYNYNDADGKLLYQVVRFVPKDFRQRQPDPDKQGKWIWNLKGVKPVPYRLPQVLKSKASETIFVCEGEKDCDAVVKLGLQATCNSGGALKWTDSHSQALKGAKSVVVIADKDEPTAEFPEGKGWRHARSVCSSLKGVADSVKCIELPDRNGRKVKDAADWIAAGGTADELVALAASTPTYGLVDTATPTPITNEHATANPVAKPPVVPDVGSGTAILPHQPFPLYRFSTLKSYCPKPQDNIAGDGWLRRGAGCLVAGSTGNGKSVLVEQLCVSVASGHPFLGIRLNQAGRVLYIQAENDADTLRRDILSLVKNIEGKVCPFLVEINLLIAHAYGLSGNDFVEWLGGLVEKERPDLIVIDPYQSYIGGADINKSETFLGWIKPIDALIKSRRCGLVLVAHTPKPRDRENWNARDSVYMASGSSTISNWCRTSCELTQDGDDGHYRLRFGKNAERTGLVDDWGKITRDIFIEHSHNRNEPCWVLSPVQTATTKSKYRDAILSTKLEHPDMSLSQIGNSVGCSKALVQRILSSNPMSTAVHRTRTPLKGVYECTGQVGRPVDSQVSDGIRVYDSFSQTSVSEPTSDPIFGNLETVKPQNPTVPLMSTTTSPASPKSALPEAQFGTPATGTADDNFLRDE